LELTIFARFHARPGQEERVAALIVEMTDASREEPGCRAIHRYRSTGHPALCVIHSVWTDEAAIELHAGLPHTVHFLAEVEPLIDHPLDIQRTRPF
jgi:quinol monooxygenase YgiN